MLAATLREKTMPVKKTKEHPDGLSQKPKSRDDDELERLVDMMVVSVHEAVKEVRAARKQVRKANQDYAKRNVA